MAQPDDKLLQGGQCVYAAQDVFQPMLIGWRLIVTAYVPVADGLCAMPPAQLVACHVAGHHLGQCIDRRLQLWAEDPQLEQDILYNVLGLVSVAYDMCGYLDEGGPEALCLIWKVLSSQNLFRLLASILEIPFDSNCVSSAMPATVSWDMP